ncbi:MAG: histidine phosphatase family protein [Synergistaceae bacterium]|nr:histidine phosphatase family protein [Synergistaceae bacterium]
MSNNGEGILTGNMQIFMLRHGQPKFPDSRPYVYGQTDYPLSEKGLEQARRMGAALSGIPMRRIISSDLSRAARTAEIVAEMQAEKICKPERDPELREMNMGEWDGRLAEDVNVDFADIYGKKGRDIVTAAPPGGESFSDLRERGVTAFDRIIDESSDLGRILIVAHANLIWSIVSRVFGIPLGSVFSFAHAYCGLHVLERRKEASDWGLYRLVRYNWLPNPDDQADRP